jgi:glycosyltransferase involved in cell wall biosynthesis/peptidoglycan/xylan/chitin deacetylase (PgdA/CDA1 family)
MRRSIPVLCYHNIDGSGDTQGALGHPQKLFEQHLDLIQQLGFITISASHLLDICAGVRPHDAKYLVITFDDGLLGQWLYAAPMLAERNMTAAFFAVTDFIRPGTPRLREQAPPLSEIGEAFKRALALGDCAQFMNRSELAALGHDYGMEVFAHSAAHQGCFRSLKRIADFSDQAHWTTWGIYPERFPGYPVFEHGSAYAYNGYWPRTKNTSTPTFRLRSDEERYDFCLQDFRRSFDHIAQINHADRQFLCWPWGQFDPIAEQACQAAGFAGAFTLERSCTGRGTSPFRLNRIRIGRTHTRGQLRTRLAMYSTALGTSLFSKHFRKKPETRRVLYVTDSTRISGGGRQLLNNVAAMSECGVHAHVLAPSDSPLASALDSAGTSVIPWEHPRHLVRSALFLARIVRSHQIDVVHAFHSRPGKVAVLAKLLDGRFRLFLNRGVTYPPNPLIGLFAAIADGVICNSYASANVLKACLTPKKRINVVYNSLDAPVPRQTREPRDSLRVLYVGNGDSVKGFDIFLRTAQAYGQRYPESPVTFVSYGVETDADIARRGCQETLARMEIHAPAAHDAVLQALAGVDIFVLTSRMESLPNVLLEAFSRSLPVVCTDVGGVKEVVRDGVNGWLCPSEDVHMLADKLHDLVEHPDRRLAMGALNHRMVTAWLNNGRKGYLLLRVYSGERIADAVDCEQGAGVQTCAT